MKALFFLLCLFPLNLSAESLLQKHSSRPLQAEATMEALEPWETPITGFFIRSHHGVPKVENENWVLKIDGLVDKTLTLNLKDIQRMPTHTLHAVLECSGNYRGMQEPQVPGVQWGKGAVGNAEWTGIRLKDLLKKAGIKSTAKFVRVEGADKPAMSSTPEFVRSIPINKMLEEDTLLAWKMNRQTMPVLHGGPLRLILPRWYGQNWIKWVTHLTLTDSEDKGFYMAKGYRMPKQAVKPGEKWDSATGTPVEKLKVQSLIVSPKLLEIVGIGEVTVKGKAFSGEGEIAKVEVSSDNGENWNEAKVETAHADGGWQEFEIKVQAKKTGSLSLLSRATDKAGNIQPLVAEWNPPGYLRNSVDRIEVKVVKEAPANEEILLGERCLTCHARELISSQRLSEDAWGKTITKMEGFGAKLEAGEKERLVKYLSQVPLKESSTPTSFWVESSLVSSQVSSHGKKTRGKTLFSKNCASCHGKTGDGGTAPRLKGRDIPFQYFLAVVGGGKGNMPAFGDAFTRQDVVDLEGFVRGL